jgi:tetratricopeptide (TPR) repeat protein
VQLLNRDFPKAESYFEKALQKDPDFVPALRHLAETKARTDRLAQAIERVRAQIKLRPKNAEYYVLLGRLYGQKKDTAEMRRQFEKALEIEPDSQDALLSLARLEQEQGSLDSALKKYAELRKKNPNNLAVAMLMATLLEQAGDSKQAKGIYEQVLEKNPDISAAANNLAFYYAQYEPTTENLLKAKRLVGPLMTRFKDNPNVVDTAAWIEYRQGNLEKARDLFSGVEAEGKKIPVISYHMGMLYFRLGDTGKARSFLQAAVKGPDKFPGREEAEKTLREIG